MDIKDIIDLAVSHITEAEEDRMISSAILCIGDAKLALANGNIHEAKRFAVKSLAYTVGILHHDYRRATTNN